MKKQPAPRIEVEPDPADLKHGILSLRCEVDADLEVTHKDGSTTAVQLRAGVQLRHHLKDVVFINVRTYAPGHKAPTN